MSDTNTTIKTPLWKQLVGAATGAAVAFVVYQGYTFTSEHLTALVTLPQGSGIMDRSGTPTHVWPTGTAESPVAVVASSSSVAATVVSSSATAQNSSARVFLGPFGSIKGLKKFFQFGQNGASSLVAPSAVNVLASSAASSLAESSSSLAPPTKSRIIRIQERASSSSVTPVKSVAPVAPVKKHPGTLPKSGFGLDVLAVIAVGSVLGRKRAMRK